MKQKNLRGNRFMLVWLLLVAALVSAGSLALVLRGAPLPGGSADNVAPGTPVATTTADSLQRPGEALPGRIVFIDGRGQIGTIDSAGENQRQVTAGPRLFLFPAWSPAGASIAAIGAEQGGSGVFTFADEEQAEAQELYFDGERAPIYLYWSPDGRQVSFIAQHENGLGLFLAAAQTSAESRLLASGQPLYWDWAGGGRHILVHSGSSGPQARLELFDVAQIEEQTEGENLTTPGFFQAPGFSQDGRYIAYAEVDDEQSRWLVVQEWDSGEGQRVEHSGAVAFGWSPVEEQLAFISPDLAADEEPFSFHGPLRLMDAATGAVRVLSEDRVIAFFWSPDGEAIAYLTVTRGSGEQIAGARGELLPVSRAAQPIQQEFRFTLWLAQISSGQVRRLIDFRPGSLFVTQFLPFFDQYALSHRIWSPDSTALLLPVVEEGQSRIYVIARDGEAFWPIVEGQIAFWSHR
ncbi:MAG: TolB family protein [Chloroflexota bacterium]